MSKGGSPMSEDVSHDDQRGSDTQATSRSRELGVMSIPNTMAGSLVHHLFGHDNSGSRPSWAKAYFISVAITYVPLLLAAVLSPLSLLATPPCPTGIACVKLPFMHDWNIAFAFLVSFPTLATLLVTDDYVLRSSLRRVHRDGVMSISEQASSELVGTWEGRFRTANIVGQLAGLAIGIVLGLMTQRIYMNPSMGFWISAQGKLLAVGYVYVYCIVLLYALVTVYVLRSVVVSFFLNDLVAKANVRMMPFHPDKCGGFRPVGQLGLRNQYTLTILGLNVVLLAAVSMTSLSDLQSIRDLIIAAMIAYAILGPIVFIGPLMPFRTGMLREKGGWMSEIAQRVRIELERLRIQIRAGEVTKEDEDLIERLRKIGAVVDELPVWPFDARTLRQFATAYILPLGATLLGRGVAFLMGWHWK